MRLTLLIIFSLLIISLSLPPQAVAQRSYVDPQERFALNLPSDWDCAPSEIVRGSTECRKKQAYFTGIYISFFPGDSDLSRHFHLLKQLAQLDFHKNGSIE